MLRNDLIVLISEKDNDTVTVNINGILIDVEAVSNDRGCVVLEVDQDEVRDALSAPLVRTERA